MAETLPTDHGPVGPLDAARPKFGADPETAELCLLLETIFERHGIDFRDYAHLSLKRRVLRRVVEEEAGSMAGLRQLALADPACMERLVTGLTVHTTALFRDPEFYVTLRDQIVPILRTYPFLRLWVAG